MKIRNKLLVTISALTLSLLNLHIAESATVSVENGTNSSFSNNNDNLSYTTDTNRANQGTITFDFTASNSLNSIGNITVANDGYGLLIIKGTNSNNLTTTIGNIGDDSHALSAIKLNFIDSDHVVEFTNNVNSKSIVFGANNNGTIYFNSSNPVVNSTITTTTSGYGKLKFAESANINGMVGTSSNPLSTVITTGSGQINFNNESYIALIHLQDNSTVSFAGGVIGSVTNDIFYGPSIEFKSSTTVQGDVGSEDGALSVVYIGSAATSTIGGKLYTSGIDFQYDGTLVVGGGIISGVGTDNTNTGNLTLSSATIITTQIDYSITQAIGTSGAALSNLNIANKGNNKIVGDAYVNNINFKQNGTLTVLGNIYSNVNNAVVDGNGVVVNNQGNLIASTGASIIDGAIGKSGAALYNFTIDNDVDVSVTGAIYSKYITLNNGAILSIGEAGYNGTINASNSGYGVLNINGSQTTGGNIGADYKLSDVNIASGVTLNVANNIKANNINLASGSILNISNATISGAINGVADNKGTINAISKFILDGNVGNSHSLAHFNVGSDGDVVLEGNLTASDINNSGILYLTNTSRNIRGNVVSSGLLNLGTASHIVTGSLSFSGAVTTLIASGTVAGNISSSDSLTINSETKLNVNFSDSSVIRESGSYLIFTGVTDGGITKISDSNINLGGNGSNSTAMFSASTRKDGNNIYLDISKLTPVFSGASAKGAYDIINSIAEESSGEVIRFLSSIQSLPSSSISSALETITARHDAGVSNTVIAAVSGSVNTVENRVSLLRNSSGSNDLEKISSRENYGIASGDNLSGYGVWGQFFGSKGDGEGAAGSSGYGQSMTGVSVGIDSQVKDSVLIGMNFSYASSENNSHNHLKANQVDSYQINSYASKSIGKYFVDGMLGFVWNNYHSDRAIPLIGQTASADYSGQTYIANLSTGFTENLSSKLNITPTIGLSYAHNNIDSYVENGAGTLDLEVNSQTSNYLQAKVGSDLSYYYQLSKYTALSPYIKIYYGHEFIGDAPATITSFAGQSAILSTQGVKASQDSYNGGLGVNIYNAKDITISLDYSYEYRTDYHGNNGMFKFKYNF